MLVIDINAEKASRIVQEIKDAASDLLIRSDPDSCNHAYNTILEKSDALLEVLLKLKYVQEDRGEN